MVLAGRAHGAGLAFQRLAQQRFQPILAEHAAPIGLLREALANLDSAYVHVLDAVVATLPEQTPEIVARMAELAASGPPVEQVGLEPFPVPLTLEPIGGRR